MKNRTMTFLLAAALIAPTASLWAAAGDASTQGPGATTTGTAQPKTKKHHGHHHKKSTAAATPSASNTSSSSGVK